MNIPLSSSGLSRREMLKLSSCGFGYLALAGLCAEAAADTTNPLAPQVPHFAPRAKRVIFMFMRGGPSQQDTFDYKPQLAKDDGQPYGDQDKKKARKLMKPLWNFQQRGESGLWISELFPQLAEHADDLCLLNGMHCDSPNHALAVVQLHTGDFRFVRPSMGSWILYGLGTENQNLPGFITINPSARIGGGNYGSAFLPAAYQGTAIGKENQPVEKATFPHLKNASVSRPVQQEQLDLLQKMNRERLQQDRLNSQLEGLIESYELAARMQMVAPETMDLSRESRETHALYGIGEEPTDNFGQQCLLARRFAERGVRFIQLNHSQWDQHGKIFKKLPANCEQTDKPIAGLITDLKKRGMLEETLLVWGGEFGRTSHAKRPDGRDHQATGYTMWMAGGGVQGGLRYGATDEHGIKAVDGRVHVHDLHATILHLLGLNHKNLTYRYSGRDFRLTDVHGNVVEEIVA